MEVEKHPYENGNYPYFIRDCWGGQVELTVEDLLALKKSLENLLKK